MTMPSQQARETTTARLEESAASASAAPNELNVSGLISQTAPVSNREIRRDVIPASSPQDKLRSYKVLVERAVEVFGDELTASRWLSTPTPDLAGKVPLQLAQELQYDPTRLESAFEPIFVRIEHGIYT